MCPKFNHPFNLSIYPTWHQCSTFTVDCLYYSNPIIDHPIIPCHNSGTSIDNPIVCGVMSPTLSPTNC